MRRNCLLKRFAVTPSVGLSILAAADIWPHAVCDVVLVMNQSQLDRAYGSGMLSLSVLPHQPHIQVRLANILDSWEVPDTDGTMAPSTRRIVRALGSIPDPIGPRPSWLQTPGAPTSRPALPEDSPARAFEAAWMSGAEDTDLSVRERGSSRASRRRSMRRQSTVNLDFTIHEDTEILQCGHRTSSCVSRVSHLTRRVYSFGEHAQNRANSCV